jgi:hypothetical protein
MPLNMPEPSSHATARATMPHVFWDDLLHLRLATHDRPDAETHQP